MFSSSFSLLAWSYEGATGKRFFLPFNGLFDSIHFSCYLACKQAPKWSGTWERKKAPTQRWVPFFSLRSRSARFGSRFSSPPPPPPQPPFPPLHLGACSQASVTCWGKVVNIFYEPWIKSLYTLQLRRDSIYACISLKSRDPVVNISE